MKQAYLISSNPFDSLDSVKEVTGFQTFRPVMLEVLMALYVKVPSSGCGMTVELPRTVFETLKRKTTNASEIFGSIYQPARRHITEEWNVNFHSS